MFISVHAELVLVSHQAGLYFYKSRPLLAEGWSELLGKSRNKVARKTSPRQSKTACPYCTGRLNAGQEILYYLRNAGTWQYSESGTMIRGRTQVAFRCRAQESPC